MLAFTITVFISYEPGPIAFTILKGPSFDSILFAVDYFINGLLAMSRNGFEGTPSLNHQVVEVNCATLGIPSAKHGFRLVACELLLLDICAIPIDVVIVWLTVCSKCRYRPDFGNDVRRIIIPPHQQQH